MMVVITLVALPYFNENFESITGNSESDKKKLKIWLEATIKLPLN